MSLQARRSLAFFYRRSSARDSIVDGFGKEVLQSCDTGVDRRLEGIIGLLDRLIHVVAEIVGRIVDGLDGFGVGQSLNEVVNLLPPFRVLTRFGRKLVVDSLRW